MEYTNREKCIVLVVRYFVFLALIALHLDANLKLHLICYAKPLRIGNKEKVCFKKSST